MSSGYSAPSHVGFGFNPSYFTSASSGSYLTKSTGDTRYLQLSGGTESGSVLFSGGFTTAGAGIASGGQLIDTTGKEHHLYSSNATDPNTGVGRNLKISGNGLAVKGGIYCDDLTSTGSLTTTGALTPSNGISFNNNQGITMSGGSISGAGSMTTTGNISCGNTLTAKSLTLHPTSSTSINNNIYVYSGSMGVGSSPSSQTSSSSVVWINGSSHGNGGIIVGYAQYLLYNQFTGSYSTNTQYSFTAAYTKYAGISAFSGTATNGNLTVASNSTATDSSGNFGIKITGQSVGSVVNAQITYSGGLIYYTFLMIGDGLA